PLNRRAMPALERHPVESPTECLRQPVLCKRLSPSYLACEQILCRLRRMMAVAMAPCRVSMVPMKPSDQALMIYSIEARRYRPGQEEQLSWPAWNRESDDLRTVLPL